MRSEATAPGVEDCGLCLLDIVKHAVKTVINTLDENDRLSLVSYSNNASVVFGLMSMNNTGKENAVTLLEQLTPGGMTNLWDGLHTGLEILKNRAVLNASSVRNNSALLLLTDGEPNIEPPRGHLPMLKRYKDSCDGRFPGVISTFGFGYSLDSVLLRKIAYDGGGMYAFIPDSGFVGTAFVNSLANMLSTVTTDAELVLTLDPNSKARCVVYLAQCDLKCLSRNALYLKTSILCIVFFCSLHRVTSMHY
jgi:von Willebrand factor type A domain